MIATAARILLSTFVLLLAVLLSPFIFAEAEPEVPPVWSLRVMQTPVKVAVGDVVAVEVVLLRNGLPAQMANGQLQISLAGASEIMGDGSNPPLVERTPLMGERTELTQRWRGEFSAVRPGEVSIHAQVSGTVEVMTPGMPSRWMQVEAEGQSLPLTIAMPVAEAGGILTSLYAALMSALVVLGMGVLLLRRRGQGQLENKPAEKVEPAM